MGSDRAFRGKKFGQDEAKIKEHFRPKVKKDIKKAIRGMIVMSADLDSMYTSFLNNMVPTLWEQVSFASLKVPLL